MKIKMGEIKKKSDERMELENLARTLTSLSKTQKRGTL